MEFNVCTVKVLHALEKKNNIQTIEKISKRNQKQKKKTTKKQNKRKTNGLRHNRMIKTETN